MLILTGCHATRESCSLTHVRSSGIIPWFSCITIETSISMDDSFELSVNTTNLMSSRCDHGIDKTQR